MIVTQPKIYIEQKAFEEVKVILKEYNMSVAEAITLFISKIRLEKKMPFEINLLNESKEDYLTYLKNRHIIVDDSIKIDLIMNGINNGLS